MGLFFYTAGPVSPTEPTFIEQAQRCVGENNQSYFCESGHCCEELQCCNYYYELWWFWLMCAITFILTCCCVCHHRRAKHRLQQQQRQHEINLIAYREACNYTSPPFYFRFLPSYLLPDYEDVASHPLTPPPPYCNLNAGTPACTNNDQEEARCASRQATPVPTVSAALCSSPDIVELENSRENQHRDNGKDRETMLKQDMDHKDQERYVEVPEEKNDELVGRRRHFTGDSGIEVCLCSRRTESHRPRELVEILSNEDDGSSMEFCDDCGARDDKDGHNHKAEVKQEQEAVNNIHDQRPVVQFAVSSILSQMVSTSSIFSNSPVSAGVTASPDTSSVTGDMKNMTRSQMSHQSI